jgi:hypothetical protein
MKHASEWRGVMLSREAAASAEAERQQTTVSEFASRAVLEECRRARHSRLARGGSPREPADGGN